MSARQFRRNRDREARHTRVTSAAGAALGGTVLFAPAADAATFTVANLEDDGAGSLRQAVADANTTPGAGDVITFQAGLSGTITLTTFDIEIEEGVAIQGPGASVLTIDGNEQDRIFYVNTETTGVDREAVTISGLTLTKGGDVSEGGAIRSLYTDLRIADAAFVANEASSQGGALYHDSGPLTIQRSTFTGNAAANGGGVYTDGDQGPEPADDVLIQDSVFTGNEATSVGGAAYFDNLTGGDVVLERSAFTDNEADIGGAIQFHGPQGIVRVQQSTVSGNRATDKGAGINVGYPYDAVAITNTTISGNSGAEQGGGIYVDNDSDVPVAITSSTIVGNSADAGGGIYRLADDDTTDGDDTIALTSTIVSGNTAADGSDLFEEPTDPSGSFAAGFSLIGSTVGATLTTTAPTITGIDPQLGPLQNNGGPTLTHAPSFTSPVIDKGIASGLAADQRGAPRTFDANNVANATGGDGTDIGAVEVLPGNRLALAQCKGKTENFLFGAGGTIVGTTADDVIVGTPAADQIDGGKGKDTICAGAGNDSTKGGAGKDNVSGNAGKDRLKGNGGNDKLQGNAGRDTLKGGGGKDTLKGGGGKDKLRGGPGKDKLKGGGGKDSEVQ